MRLGVLLNGIRPWMLQVGISSAAAGAPDMIDQLEASVAKAGNVSAMMKEGLGPQDIILRLLGEENVEILKRPHRL